MIHIILGTKAQLIKMAPVMRELQDRSINYNFIVSGQHKETMDDLRHNFGLKEPDIVLYDGPDIIKVHQMAVRLIKITYKVLKNKKAVFKGDKKGIVLNHGDTITTLLGSWLAKISGLKSGHVESGLRSFNFFHPFPEEIIRCLAFYMADYFFAPDNWCINNLAKFSGEKINTRQNTVADAIHLALNANRGLKPSVPKEKFALVSLHRYENVFKKKQLKRLIRIIEKVAKEIKVLFILHPPTESQLNKYNFFKRLESNNNIELRPRYDYFSFIKILEASSFLITDGGSNQEESFYLGKPCLIFRKATERREGLGANAVLSQYNEKIIDNFLKNYRQYRRPKPSNGISPSNVIVDYLEKILLEIAKSLFL